MSFQMKYTVTPTYLTPNTKRRSGIQMPAVKFIVAHDTGNPGSTAKGNVSYYNRSANDMSASAHIFVDDKEIIECIPALTGKPEKAWHVLYNRTEDNGLYGDDANDVAIGVELCYGGKINNEEAYKRYVWVLAYICYKFNLDPSKHITGHFILDPQRKTDPENALKTMGKSFKQLLEDVKKEYNNCLQTSKQQVKTQTTQKTQTKKYIGEIEIISSMLNLRKESNLNSTIVKVASKGQKFKVVKQQNNMYLLDNGLWCSSNQKYVKFKPL
ncbi:MAG: N-acetylmuramoyl-L-alanine amidase [Ignavibacterium sp.]|nr:N-acetylmuramoyl-L-alanine amidase [Ignavibacterium sp.]